MGDLLVWSLRAGRKQSGADGVAASLGEREARERAAERDATQAVSKARRDLRERSPGADLWGFLRPISREYYIEQNSILYVIGFIQPSFLFFCVFCVLQ